MKSRKTLIVMMSFMMLISTLILPIGEAKALNVKKDFSNNYLDVNFDENDLSDENFTTEELEQIDKIAMDLKFYFEEAGEFTEQGYVVKNEALFQERIKNGDESAERILASVRENEMVNASSSTTFAKCVVDKFADSWGNVARAWTTGAVFTYIKNKQYDLAAKVIFKTATKAGRTANVASIAAEIAYYGYLCRGKW